MRFGSVEFFKVLIKSVLAVIFFAPLVLCVVFGVLLWKSSSKVEEARQEAERAKLVAQVFTEKQDTIEGFYELYSKSGFSDEELISYINEKNGVSAPQDNGQTPAAAESGESGESGESAQSAQTEQAAEPESPYAALYEDMYVSSPAEADMVREEGTVYLTFDDGPSQNTYAVLSYLKKFGAKATFFVVPSRTDECYELMRAIVNEGHAIGVHSASHDYNKIYASTEAFLADFNEAWNIVYEATGVKTQIFRFPGGSKNDFNEATRDDIIKEMTRRGFRYFDWNVDSRDAGGATWTDMYNSVPQDIAGNYRSVVLMHDSEPHLTTVLVLEDILNVLTVEGYKLDRINDDTRPVQFIGPYA